MLKRILLLIVCLFAASPAWAKDWATNYGDNKFITTNGQCVIFDVGGMGTGSWEITGTWTGTISMYLRGNAQTPNLVDVNKADTPSTTVNTTTANGIWSGPIASYKFMAACATASMTGSANIILSAAGTGGGGGAGGGGGGGGVVEGMGTLGTPAGGVLTVQGGTAGTPLPTMEDPTSSLTVYSQASSNTLASILAAMNADKVRDVALAADAAGPLQICLGSAATPTTMSADNDATAVWCDKNGRVQMNVAMINGVAPSMGNGVSGTGVPRVTIASDSTGQVALAAGSATIGALTANQSVNLAQLAGATISATNPVPVVFPGTLVSGAVTSAMTGTTSTSTVSGTASNFLYITSCVVSNASLTVSTDILLQDGSGGTTLYVLPAPAATVATTGGGGATHNFGGAPLKVPTSGNALFAANVTTGSSTKISCNGFRSTVSY